MDVEVKVRHGLPVKLSGPSAGDMTPATQACLLVGTSGPGQQLTLLDTVHVFDVVGQEVCSHWPGAATRNTDVERKRVLSVCCPLCVMLQLPRASFHMVYPSWELLR